MPPYMTFDSNGNLVSYGYSSDALPLPTGAIEVTQDQLNSAPNWQLENGSLVVDTEPANFPALKD
jgi:hypothetical protein